VLARLVLVLVLARALVRAWAPVLQVAPLLGLQLVRAQPRALPAALQVVSDSLLERIPVNSTPRHSTTNAQHEIEQPNASTSKHSSAKQR